MKFATAPYGQTFEFEPTDDPMVMVAHDGFNDIYIYCCPICVTWAEALYEDLEGLSMCDRCASVIANRWHFRRSGEFITWSNAPRESQERQRVRFSVAFRREIYERDGYRCRYCGGYEGGLSLDHIMPWSRGGSDDPSNLATACAPCNTKKRNRTPEEAGMSLKELP